jgi:Na+-driven multidrug efflux pump
VPLAHRFFRLTTWITLGTVFVLQVSIFFAKNAIAEFYSSDPEVQELTESVLSIVSVVFLFDGMQAYL